MTHTVIISNTGNVALRGFNFTPDGTPVNTTCSPVLAAGRLEAGSEVTCQVVYAINQDSLELDTSTYSAEVTALPSFGAAAAGFSEVLQLAAVTAVNSPSLSVTINTANCAVPELAGELCC